MFQMRAMCAPPRPIYIHIPPHPHIDLLLLSALTWRGVAWQSGAGRRAGVVPRVLAMRIARMYS